MTKDRARKRATRNRVALTGERYVVARRATPQLPLHGDGWWHEITHRVPGVPPHVDGGRHGRANPAPRHHGRANRRHTEPHVLVAWQGWIARRVGAGRE